MNGSKGVDNIANLPLISIVLMSKTVIGMSYVSTTQASTTKVTLVAELCVIFWYR